MRVRALTGCVLAVTAAGCSTRVMTQRGRLHPVPLAAGDFVVALVDHIPEGADGVNPAELERAFQECLAGAMARAAQPGGTLAAAEFRTKVLAEPPGATAPIRKNTLLERLRNPAMRERATRLGVRHVVLMSATQIKTRLDGEPQTGYYERHKSTAINAEIVDVREHRAAASANVTVRGSSGMGGVPGFPIPLFGWSSKTRSKACTAIGDELVALFARGDAPVPPEGDVIESQR